MTVVWVRGREGCGPSPMAVQGFLPEFLLWLTRSDLLTNMWTEGALMFRGRTLHGSSERSAAARSPGTALNACGGCGPHSA